MEVVRLRAHVVQIIVPIQLDTAFNPALRALHGFRFNLVLKATSRSKRDKQVFAMQDRPRLVFKDFGEWFLRAIGPHFDILADVFNSFLQRLFEWPLSPADPDDDAFPASDFRPCLSQRGLVDVGAFGPAVNMSMPPKFPVRELVKSDATKDSPLPQDTLTQLPKRFQNQIPLPRHIWIRPNREGKGQRRTVRIEPLEDGPDDLRNPVDTNSPAVRAEQPIPATDSHAEPMPTGPALQVPPCCTWWLFTSRYPLDLYECY